MSITIYNTDTGATVELSIIDPKTDIDWVADCIGNTAHGMSTNAPTGVDADANYYANSDQIAWWSNYLTAQQAADNRLHAALKECSDEQWAALISAKLSEVFGDIEDHPAQLNAIIDRVMGEEFTA